MTKEQIEERIKSKQDEVKNLEASHQKFVEQFNKQTEQFNKQVAINRDEYNKLIGGIAELQEMLNTNDA